MKRDFTHTHETLLDREDRDIPVSVEIDWFWDEGEQSDPGQPRYNRGWYGEAVARDAETRKVIDLTEREREIILEECHPDVLPDPRDGDTDDGYEEEFH